MLHPVYGVLKTGPTVLYNTCRPVFYQLSYNPGPNVFVATMSELARKL